MDFEIITLIGGGVAAGALAHLLSELVQRAARIRELTKSEKNTDADEVLSSGDIDKIGKYIYEEVGSIRLKDFTLNREIEDKLNTIIDKVEDFFGEVEGEAPESPLSESPPEINLSGLPDEYDVFLDELRRGELWNCLAKLRLFTEQKLANLANADGVAVPRHRSARQLLRALTVSGQIDHEMSSHLDYVLTIANRAIHGEEVDDEIAIEAVQSAITAFQRLNKPN